jgi:hypothetical protein
LSDELRLDLARGEALFESHLASTFGKKNLASPSENSPPVTDSAVNPNAMNEPRAISRNPRRSSSESDFFAAGFAGRGGTAFAAAGFAMWSAAAAGFTAAGFAGRGGASALLMGPGFAPARAAARMLAVSRATAALAATGFAALAAAGFSAGFAVGLGADFVGDCAGASAAALLARAIAMISATLGLAPPAVGFGAALAAGFSTTGVSAAESTASAAPPPAGSTAGAAASPPPAWALAAARISETDIFFRSAITVASTVFPTGRANRTTSANDRPQREIHSKSCFRPGFEEFVIFFTNSLPTVSAPR